MRIEYEWIWYSLNLIGKVYGWGMSTSQQTGHGDDEDILVPTIMPGKQLQNR